LKRERQDILLVRADEERTLAESSRVERVRRRRLRDLIRLYAAGSNCCAVVDLINDLNE